jgi:hypothetical protein
MLRQSGKSRKTITHGGISLDDTLAVDCSSATMEVQVRSRLCYALRLKNVKHILAVVNTDQVWD